MPHIIVEHTAEVEKSIDLFKLNQTLHSQFAQHETIKLGSIKTRSQLTNNVIVGEGNDNNFIHINILLLPGRSESLKRHMVNDIFKTAKEFIASDSFTLSVNISDLGVYAK